MHVTVGRAIVPPVGHALDVRVSVEREERVGRDDDVHVAQQHAHANREELVQDLELEARGGVVVRRAWLGLG